MRRIRPHFLRLPLSALGFLVLCSWLVAQQQPTSDAIAELKNKFADERAVAVRQQFPLASLERADQLAARAAAAAEKERFREAARFYREARWHLPYLPGDLPPHVERIYGQARMRHGAPLHAIAFSPDGRFIAGGSDDGVVKMWDLANGRELLTYRGHSAPVRGVAFSPNGKLIASSGDREIHLWEAETGKLKATFKGHTGTVNLLAFHPAGDRVASGGDDKFARVWTLDGKEVAALGPQAGWVYHVSWSSNGKLLSAVNQDGQLQIYNPSAERGKTVFGTLAHRGSAYLGIFAPDGKTIYTCGDKLAIAFGAPGPDGEILGTTGTRRLTFEGHTDLVTALALSSDGKLLATGSKDRSIRLWNTGDGKLLRTFQGHNDEVSSLAFSPTGDILASAGKDQNIRLWNLQPVDDHRAFEGHTGYVWTVAFSPDGKSFASAGADRTIRVYDAVSGALRKTLQGHSKAVTALVFAPDGASLYSASGDRSVRRWSSATGEVVREFVGHTEPVLTLTLSPDGKTLLSGAADRKAILWDTDSGRQIAVLAETDSMIAAVALRADGEQALLGCANGELLIVNPKQPKTPPTRLRAHRAGVSSIAYSPDSTRVVTGGGESPKNLLLWSVTPDGKLAEFGMLSGHLGPVTAAVFSPDGNLVAAGGQDRVVKIWSAQTLREVRSLRGHTDWIGTVTFSPDNKLLLSGGVDRSVRLWELTTEEAVVSLGHSRRITAVAVNATGELIASASEDRTIRLWDKATTTEVGILSGHTDQVTTLAFIGDGKRLVSAGEDLRLRFWNVPARKEITSAEIDRASMIHVPPDGKHVLVLTVRTTNDRKIAVIRRFDAEGKPILSLEERDRGVTCAGFSGDGEWAAVGDDSGTVRIWEIATSKRIGGDLPAHAAAVRDLALTADRKHLITADDDGTIKVWDIAKRDEVRQFVAHKGGLVRLLLEPSGKRIVTIGKTGEVRLWDFQSGKPLRAWGLPTLVNDAAFTPDGKGLLTANGDTTMYLLTLP